jgi:hypothetical protein
MTLGGGVEGRHLPGQVVVPRAGGELGTCRRSGDAAETFRVQRCVRLEALRVRGVRRTEVRRSETSQESKAV